MTTPAQDAPLVFPSVAFRPIRLLVISLALTAVAVLAASRFGHPMVGAFFGIGLLMGLLNALGVRHSVAVITADEHPLKKKMALNSAGRLAVISVIALVIAFVFRPAGLGVVFGLALFQILLVLSTALPVWKKLRTGTAELGPDSSGTERNGNSDD
ncbi:MAG: ATP synthase subunit I [Mycobacterium sp.]